MEKFTIRTHTVLVLTVGRLESELGEPAVVNEQTLLGDPSLGTPPVGGAPLPSFTEQ